MTNETRESPPLKQKKKRCRGPWVLVATDRRALGRDVKVLCREVDAKPFVTLVPRLYRRFDSRHEALRWLKRHVKSNRYLFTPDLMPLA